MTLMTYRRCCSSKKTKWFKRSYLMDFTNLSANGFKSGLLGFLRAGDDSIHDRDGNYCPAFLRNKHPLSNAANGLAARSISTAGRSHESG